MTTGWLRNLLWDLYESYYGWYDCDNNEYTEEDWTEWGTHPERRQLIYGFLVRSGLRTVQAEGVLHSVTWMQEHFVHSPRELGEHIDAEAERLQREHEDDGTRDVVHGGVPGGGVADASHRPTAQGPMTIEGRLDLLVAEVEKVRGLLRDGLLTPDEATGSLAEYARNLLTPYGGGITELTD